MCILLTTVRSYVTFSSITESVTQTIDIAVARRTDKNVFASLILYYALTRSLQLSTFYNTVVCIFIIM